MTDDDLELDDPPVATVNINIPLPAELHHRLKIRAVTAGVHMRDVVVTAIAEYLA